MTIYHVLKRLFHLVPVLLVVSAVTFGLIYLAPGDPAVMALRAAGMEPDAEAVEQIRHELGLDDPVFLQYFRWLWRALHGDLGRSIRTGKEVSGELLGRFPATMALALAALAIAMLLSFPLGVLAAVRKGSVMDHASRVMSLAGASIPGFFLGILLIQIFAVKLKVLPVMGYGGWRHLILPAITIGLGMAAVYTRMLRAGVLEILGEDFIRVARAKGLSEARVVGKHAIRNAILPTMTLVGTGFGYLLGGAVIVETIFVWPGLGKLAVDAIFNRDYPVVQGYALLMTLIFVLVNMAVDIAYTVVDPRIRVAVE